MENIIVIEMGNLEEKKKHKCKIYAMNVIKS
jgi:hypothetical protein